MLEVGAYLGLSMQPEQVDTERVIQRMLAEEESSGSEEEEEGTQPGGKRRPYGMEWA